MGINATYDPISPLTVPLSNIGGSRLNIMTHIFECVQKHDPSSLQVQKSNRMKYDTQIKWSHMTWNIPGKTFV